MSRLQFFKKLIWTPWKAIVYFVIGLISLYDLYLSQFLAETSKKYFPRLADIFVRIGLPWWLWIIIFLLFTLIIVFEGAYRDINSLIEIPQLKVLGELRAKGIVHRNSGSALLSNESMEKWREEQLAWENEVLGALKELSTVDFENFRVLGLMRNPRPFPYAINNKHRLFLQVYDEKLRRLDEIMKKYDSKGRRFNNV